MNRTARSTRITALAAAALGALAATGALAPAAQAAPAAKTAARCSTAWGSVPKVVDMKARTYGASLGAPRVGHHACFDRVVFDVKGAVGDLEVFYTSSETWSPMVLRVVAKHKSPGNGFADAPFRKTGLPTIVGTSAGYAWTDTEQSRDTAVRARLPFRVFTLKGPGTTNRVVVDVAHRW